MRDIKVIKGFSIGEKVALKSNPSFDTIPGKNILAVELGAGSG
jgi:hypothetical protein